jgi:hypothetical protein
MRFGTKIPAAIDEPINSTDHRKYITTNIAIGSIGMKSKTDTVL